MVFFFPFIWRGGGLEVEVTVVRIVVRTQIPNKWCGPERLASLIPTVPLTLVLLAPLFALIRVGGAPELWWPLADTAALEQRVLNGRTGAPDLVRCDLENFPSKRKTLKDFILFLRVFLSS